MAQEQARRAPQEGADEGEEIVVTGQRQRGAVIGDIAPEQTLSSADVRALGVTSVADLITELSPQTNGTPIVLLNGKRISSFAEIRDIPTEAIARVEILPEQVALSYGYAPTQKVANIVLRQRFRAETGELELGTTTDGGRDTGEMEAGLLRIRGDDRFTLNLEYNRAGRLLESQRDIATTPASRPFSLNGTIAATTPDGEIDLALSALAGRSVTLAAVPGGAASGAPTLGDFIAGANQPAATDLTPYRTLSPANETLSANATLARALGGVSATVNARVELSDSDSLQGLSAATLTLPAGNPFSPFGQDVTLYRYLAQAGALGQQVRGTTAHLGVTLNGRLGSRWQWSFTGNGDLSITRTRTDRGIATGAVQTALDAGDGDVNPFGRFADPLLATRLSDSARARSEAIQGDLLLTGPLFRLPAGDAITSVRLGASANGFSSQSLRAGVDRDTRYGRRIASGQVSIDLPLTSRASDVLGAVGDIGVNLNLAAQQLSDFGTLSTIGYGLRWQPVSRVQLLLSANQDRAAPTGAQITDPLVATPNVPLFDYATGQSVFVTQLSGGNAMLRQSVRDQFRLGVTIRPFDKPNLALTATYLNSRTRNPIAGFPTPTPDIEAAFPQRFLRDADGMLVQVDARPVNFLASNSAQLRWGFDLSFALKSHIQKVVEAWRAAGAKPEERPKELDDVRALFGGNRRAGNGDAPPPPPPGEGPGSGASPGNQPGRFRGPPGGGFGAGPGGRGGGRLSFSLYHTWHLEETIRIAPGLPALDLLDGDATGSAGGQPRHELQARIGYTNNGIGARLGVNWESGTHVDGALGGGSRLDFGSLATANLRLFANLGQMPSLVKRAPFLRGARVSIGIDNLFNQKREVRDATGATPLRYQQDYLDPLGRTVSISFRKLFSPAFGGAARPRG